MFAGGGGDELLRDESWGEIKALETETGELKWEFKLLSPPWSGVLSTAGGLVFSSSDEGTFYALDAKTGKPLWDFQTGSFMTTNPISINVDGRQCIAVVADRVLYVFSL
jgi:alcohol dehydrogenase (cytochrome c)